jgi:hypothetical protein
MSINTRDRANADTAHPTRATGMENESAYCGRTGEITLTPSITKPETSDRFRTTDSRCFIYRRPIIYVSHKPLSITILQRMLDNFGNKKARKSVGTQRTSSKERPSLSTSTDLAAEASAGALSSAG